VIQTVREKFSCRACETITQPPAPFHRSRAAAPANLLAGVMHGKFCDHQPLTGRAKASRAEGIDLSVSTLADWVGACTTALTRGDADPQPRVGSGSRSRRRHTVPVLAKQRHHRRLWTYVRDDRRWRSAETGGDLLLLAHRGGRASVSASRRYAGILQADAYAGFNDSTTQGGNRRRSPKPPVGARPTQTVRARRCREGVAGERRSRIDAIFDIERDIGEPRTVCVGRGSNRRLR